MNKTLLTEWMARRYMVVLVFVLLFAAWSIYKALLGAGFYSDDWTFLSLAKHGDGPLGFFIYDHSFTYMYRPIAMGTWWGVTRLADTQASVHYAFAVLIHAGNACLLAAYVRRLGVRPLLVVLIGIVFFLHPNSAATVSWLADRFDLLMSFGVLLALLASWELSSRSYFWSMSLLLGVLIAIGSKETGLVVLPALLLVVLCTPSTWRWRGYWCGLLLLLALCYFAARALVLGSLAGVAAKGSSLTPLLQGFLLWFKHLPHAFIGMGAFDDLILLLLFLGLLVLLGFGAWRRDWRVYQLLLLLPLLALLQAPVTSVVLAQEDPFASLVNHRFYYLALAAALGLLGFVLERFLRWRNATALRLIIPFCGAVLAMLWGWRAQQLVQSWQLRTGQAERVVVARAAADLAQDLADQLAGAGFEETAKGSGLRLEKCLIRLLGVAQLHTDFAGYSDLIVKAQLPPGSPALDCVFATERMPWKMLTHWSAYTAGELGLPVGREYSFRSGRLAIHAKTQEDADECPWIRYDYKDMQFQR